jgi:glycosyltransferase involved in cell wall biosynthesis
LIDGKQIVIVDGPTAFASAVAELLAEPGRRKLMGLAARRRVESLYSAKALQGMLHHALKAFECKALISAEFRF